MTLKDTETFILGSGELYIADFNYEAGKNPVIPADSTIEVAANKIGHIKGGASLEYTPTLYQVKDDFDMVLDTFITEEEVKFTSGILTWNMEVLKKIVAAAEVTTTSNLTTIKIGGRGKRGVKAKLIRFVHTIKKTGKKLRVTIVGTPSEGFSLSFQPKEEQTIDAVFLAMPHDNEGTLVRIDKEMDDVSLLNETEAAVEAKKVK